MKMDKPLVQAANRLGAIQSPTGPGKCFDFLAILLFFLPQCLSWYQLLRDKHSIDFMSTARLLVGKWPPES